MTHKLRELQKDLNDLAKSQAVNDRIRVSQRDLATVEKLAQEAGYTVKTKKVDKLDFLKDSSVMIFAFLTTAVFTIKMIAPVAFAYLEYDPPTENTNYAILSFFALSCLSLLYFDKKKWDDKNIYVMMDEKNSF